MSTQDDAQKQKGEQTLQEYLDSVAKAVESYENGELPLKELTEYMEDTNGWLKERCDEDSR